MPTGPVIQHVFTDPAAAAAQAVDKIAAARVWLLKEKPFFGVLARARLQARARRILDPARRRGFLERVVENARTLELARAWVGEG